jgi:hypothetical protein
MAGRPKGTPKTGGRKAGTPNKRTVAVQMAAAAAAERIGTVLGPDAFEGGAHALLMSVYKDPNQSIGLRLDAAKAALPFEKPRLAAIETKFVDDFASMTDEELQALVEAAARGDPLPPMPQPRGNGRPEVG